ncbi:unnamed protein product [Tetraodon nigroviridis]|nr:unnamed protein product [Tetraodon nigroviridis]
MREDFKRWNVRPEPSCKPKNEYHEPEAPFYSETQYQKDFKPWPIPKRYDHPWIQKAPRLDNRGPDRPRQPKRAAAPTAADGDVEKSAIADKVQEKDLLQGHERKKGSRREAEARRAVEGEGRGRRSTDALNRQIKEEITGGSSYRAEYKAYADVKPTRMIRAKSQYLPPEEKTRLETSYSATFRAQAPAQPADNKALDRRRVRSLYADPSKQVDRYSLPRSKAKQPGAAASGQGTPLKKAKDKQGGAHRGSRKMAAEKQPVGNKEKSKEMNNKLAEAKE